jgi:hypothetical protein
MAAATKRPNLQTGVARRHSLDRKVRPSCHNGPFNPKAIKQKRVGKANQHAMQIASVTCKNFQGSGTRLCASTIAITTVYTRRNGQ